MSKNKLIPKFRFPEFVNEGEWEDKPLDDVCKFVRGPFGGALKKEIFVKEGYAVYEQSHAIYSDFSSFRYRIDEEKYSELKRFSIKSGDLIMSCSGTMGKFAIIPKKYEDGIINQALLKLTVKNGFDNLFVKISLETDDNQNKLLSQSAGGAIKNVVSVSQIKELGLFIPSSKEQQKIASCLSSLDELIAAHNDRLQALKDHKKGLMQNLFPQEGETVPKYRFKEFEKDGEWVEKKLDELAKRGSGHTPNKKIPNYYNGGIKWVSLADTNKLDNGHIYATKIQISKEGIENSSAVRHPPGTVILSRDAGVGKSAVLFSEMAVSQHFIAWVCDESKLSNWYLYYVFQILKPVFENIAVGSTIKTIGLPYFKELYIPIPPISEQQKIASCLSSLDALIKAQSEKIAQLQLHKKGLMQGLFPKVND
jgi:type I restriction enzyme S subunit